MYKNVLYLFFFGFTHLHAQDSVLVRGKIENLTVRRYREVSSVRIIRTNLLKGQQEIVYMAPLQADGSFEVKFPILFPQEECLLSYGSWVFAPFIAQKGDIDAFIFADSVGKSPIPFRFGGLNAEANNLHAQFEVLLAGAIKSQRKYDNIFKNLANKTPIGAWSYLQEYGRFQKSFYGNFMLKQLANKLLDRWVAASIDLALRAHYYEHLFYVREAVPSVLTDSLKRGLSQVITFSESDYWYRFLSHTLNTLQSTIVSLPIDKIAGLLLKYVPNIEPEERAKLLGFSTEKVAKNSDIRLLNSMFKRNETELRLYSQHELLMRQLGDVFSAKEIDILKGMIWAETAQNLSLSNIKKLYHHVRPDIQNKLYRLSLDELFGIENKDSVAIEALKNKPFVAYREGRFRNYLVEAAPKMYLYKNELQTGQKILEGLQTEYRGKQIFLMFGALGQEATMKNLRKSSELREILPEADVVFVYICDAGSDEQFWKETAIKCKLKGVHIKNTNSQQDSFWIGRLGTVDEVPYCALIDEKGKFKYNIPLPTDQQGWQKLLKNWK